MNLRQYTASALAIAGAVLLASGCGGNSCPTETPSVQQIGNCTAKPGDAVNVPVRLCPTCNQTGAACQVDTSQLASSGIVQLDPTVEACDSVSSCSSPAPQCQTNPLTCTFTVPANTQPGTTIRVAVFDPVTSREIDGTVTVSTGVSPSCENI